jgi:hypothetical protein
MCAQQEECERHKPSQSSVDVPGQDTKPYKNTEKKPLFPGNPSGMSNNSQSHRPDQEQENHTNCFGTYAMGKGVKERIRRPSDSQDKANPEQSTRCRDQIECGGAKRHML